MRLESGEPHRDQVVVVPAAQTRLGKTYMRENEARGLANHTALTGKPVIDLDETRPWSGGVGQRAVEESRGGVRLPERGPGCVATFVDSVRAAGPQR